MTDKDNSGGRPRRAAPASGGGSRKVPSPPPGTRREALLAAAARRLAEDEAHASRQASRPAAAPAAPPAPPASPSYEPPAQAAPPEDDLSTASRPWANEPGPEPQVREDYPSPPAAAWGTPAPTPEPAPVPPSASPYPPPPPPGTWAVATEPLYSPWWKRVLATLLDIVILSVPLGIIGALLGAATPLETDPFTGETTFDLSGGYVASWIISLVVSLAYYVILEGGAGGATVGKMALGIQVRDASAFGPIGYGRALGRRLVATVLWWLLVIPGLLDVLSPLWDRRRQTWHDKAVGSVVIDKR